MRPDQPRWDDRPLSRRDLLSRARHGHGAMALASLVGGNEAFGDVARPAGSLDGPRVPGQPHFAPRAKRVIHLFLSGGPSHVDTFDPKPALDEYHGQATSSEHAPRHRTADGDRHEVAFHVPALWQERDRGQRDFSPHRRVHRRHRGDPFDAGRRTQSYPVDPVDELRRLAVGPAEPGSWVTYGLGSENQNLPGFVAMRPGGYPGNGGCPELAIGISAGRLSRNLHRHKAYADREADRKHHQPADLPRGTASAARAFARTQRRSSPRARPGRTDRRAHSVV